MHTLIQCRQHEREFEELITWSIFYYLLTSKFFRYVSRMIQYHAHDFLGSKSCVTIMSEKNSSWKKKSKFITSIHQYPYTCTVFVVWWLFQRMNTTDFQACRWHIYSQLSDLQFMQHKVTTSVKSGFHSSYDQSKSAFNSMLWKRKKYVTTF